MGYKYAGQSRPVTLARFAEPAGVGYTLVHPGGAPADAIDWNAI